MSTQSQSPCNVYYTMKLLLTEFEVHTVRYGASSIPEAIIQQEKKSRIHNLHYGASKESKGG